MTLKTVLLTGTVLAFGGAAQAQMLAFDYAGFENPDFHADYIAKHGASPDFAFFGDEEEAFQKLRSGFRADVTHICAGSVTKFMESDILEPWDTHQDHAVG
jgi:spermidine/putrescine transport system substrate-binding protein